MNFNSKPKFALFTAAVLIAGGCIGAALVGAYKMPVQAQSAPQPPVEDSSGITGSNDFANTKQTGNSDVAGIKSTSGYSKSSGFSISSRYYANPYIVQLMFSNRAGSATLPTYTVSANITLSNSEICTAFFKPTQEKYAKDPAFLTALQTILNGLLQENRQDITLDHVVVSAAYGPYTESADQLFQKFYSENDIENFAVLSHHASKKVVAECVSKAYADDHIDFFTILMDSLTNADHKKFASKAYEDDRIDFFTILMDSLTNADRKKFASKAYEDDRIDFFTILFGSLTNADQKTYAKKACADDRSDFFWILSGSLTDEERKSCFGEMYLDGSDGQLDRFFSGNHGFHHNEDQ